MVGTFLSLALFTLIAQLSDVVAAEPPGDCPVGWSNHTKYCYMYVDKYRVSMNDAEDYCQSFGAHLTSIIDKKEEEFAEKLAEYSDFWIGLKQKDDSQGTDLKRDFYWTDGSRISNYSGFSGNKVPTTYGGKDKCIVASGSVWNSRDCSVRYAFMCKVHKSQDPFTTAYPPTQPVETIPCDPTSPKDNWVQDPSDSNREFCYFYDWLHFGDWFDARDSCHNMSGTLVSIHSDAENSFVTNLIRKEPSWIGFYASHDDNWAWNDGTDVGYQRWDDGEPDNTGDKKDCVQINGLTGMWSDYDCTWSGGYVCKKPSPNISTTTQHPTPTPTGYCPPGFTQFNEYCYYWNNDQLTWSQANENCKSFGHAIGETYLLASIHSDKENALVTSLVYNDTGSEYFGGVWIGASCPGYANRDFSWVDGSDFNIQNWASDQPSDIFNCAGLQVQLAYEDNRVLGEWATTSCKNKAGSVCKGIISEKNPKPPGSACPLTESEVFQPYRDNCYAWIDEGLPWAAAEGECLKRGGHLASVLDWYEQAYVFSQVRSQTAWIGLSQVKAESPVAFWSDAHRLGIYNWADPNPASIDKGDQCAFINGTDGLWYLGSCHKSMPFLCKLSQETPTTPKSGMACKAEFKDYLPKGDHCYTILAWYEVFHKEGSSGPWSEAELWCNEKGGTLASFHSSDEVLAVLQNWYEYEAKRLWIGLHSHNDPVGLGPIWSWSDGSNATDFDNWDKGYPAQEFTGRPQCGVLMHSGFWQNMDCSPDAQAYDINFVCKAPKVDIIPEATTSRNGAAEMHRVTQRYVTVSACLILSSVLTLAKLIALN